MESTLSFYSTRSGIQSKILSTQSDNNNIVLNEIESTNDFFRSLVTENKFFNGIRYSEDGSMVALLIVNRLVVGRFEDGIVRLHYSFEDIGNIQDCYFSPLNNFLVTWQNITPKISTNLKIWNLTNNELVRSWTVKNRSCWPIISWTPDQGKAFFIPHRGALEIYENNEWENKARIVNIAGLSQFSLGPGMEPKVLVFVPENSNNTGYVSLYSIELNQPICRRSISKSDSITIQWSPDGSSVLVMTYMDIDSSGKLYSGRSGGLYLLRDNGFNCQVQFHKDNPPIQDFRWTTNRNKLEFAIVFGFIPNTDACIFNANANKMSTLISHQPRNTLIFSPCGRILAVGGFGNLQGYLDFYDVTNTSAPQLIGSTNQFSTTFHMFSPDSKYFVTGTLSPRLRVDNGVKILSYNGEQLYTEGFEELYDVRFKPSLNEPIADFNILKNNKKEESTNLTTAYVPPRRKSIGTTTTTESNTNTSNTNSRGRGRGRGGPIGYSPVGSTPKIKKNNKNNNKPKNNNNNNNNNPQNNNGNGQNNQEKPNKGKPENRIRNLNNKLKDIEKLKQRRVNGETLDEKQIEKIDNEEKIKVEIQELDKLILKTHNFEQ
jgi:translation initiation factor 2A